MSWCARLEKKKQKKKNNNNRAAVSNKSGRKTMSRELPSADDTHASDKNKPGKHCAMVDDGRDGSVRVFSLHSKISICVPDF